MKAALRLIPGIVSGRIEDPTGLMEGIQNNMGLRLLGKITDAYVTKSEGGTDEMGISWPDLSPVTLALRSRSSTPTGQKAVNRLAGDYRKMPAYTQRQIRVRYQKLLDLYQAGARGSSGGLVARKFARRLLELMKPYITRARYRTLAGQLKEQPAGRARRLAYTAAFAKILRDTGNLLRTLGPTTVGPDTILRSEPGLIAVGSRLKVRSGINLLALHDSSAPRKMKKDGTPRLPRRQVLPDDERPIPQAWWLDIIQPLVRGVSSEAFIAQVLSLRPTA